MKIFKLFILAGLFALAAPGYAAKQKTKEVALQEFTQFNLKLVPDLGTRLIFPFVLTNPKLKPPLKELMTNTVFTTDTRPEVIKNQNTIVIGIGPDSAGGSVPKYIGDYFVSVDGYNISIRLETTNRVSDHVDNVIFQLSDAQREQIIDKQVQARLAGMGGSYDTVMQGGKPTQTALQAVGSVALGNPKTRRIKEEFVIKTAEGAAVELFLDRMAVYEDYAVLIAEIKNLNSYPLGIAGFTLLHISNEDVQRDIAGGFTCPVEIARNKKSRCAYTFPVTDFINKGKYRIVLQTDRGHAEAEW